MENNILKIINKEVEDFRTKNINIVSGLLFNQYQTIQSIYYYYNSKFKSGEYDAEGDKKYFYNIVRNPCKVYSKAIDFDTKNIRLLTVEGGEPTKTWFMERDLKYWMRDKQFGKILNRLFDELPIFGSVVLKIVDGYPQFVDLRNFVLEQSADTFDQSAYIIEIHNYTPSGFRKIAKEMKWEQAKVDEVIELFHQMKDTPHIRLYERYGEVVEENEKGEKRYPYKRVFIADVGVDEYNQFTKTTEPYKGIIMAEDEWDIDALPYWEYHLEKMPGRWLGIGVVEVLSEAQIRENEVANLSAKGSFWKGLMLFFSRDPRMASNLMTDKRNGEVITGDDPITQIDMSDRNLAFFSEETNKWLKNRDELTFAYEVVAGERLPAGTPLGSAKIAMTQTLLYFETIQENIALDVKEMLYKVIMPQFDKEMRPEHIIRLIGKDLDTYISMIKDEKVFEEVVKLVLRGKMPTNYEAEAIGLAIEENMKKEGEFLKEMPKDFYKDTKYDIDIDITGESVDTRIRYSTRFALLQAITADPTILQDPIKKRILYGMAEDGGINPADLFGAEKKDINQITQGQPITRAGGGVSRMTMPTMPVAGEEMRTL